MKKNELDKILDDQEKLAIQMFYDNTIQREAVKKVLLFGIYNNGVLRKGKPADPLLNFALGLVSNLGSQIKNEELGAQLRAAWEGINLLELGFSNLAIYKKEKEQMVDKQNPAR